MGKGGKKAVWLEEGRQRGACGNGNAHCFDRMQMTK